MTAREEELERQLQEIRNERRVEDRTWREGVTNTLRRVDETVTGLAATMTTQTKELSEVRTELYGKDGQPGLKIRFDRVEGKIGLVWAAAGTAATAAGAWMWSLFTGGKP